MDYKHYLSDNSTTSISLTDGSITCGSNPCSSLVNFSSYVLCWGRREVGRNRRCNILVMLLMLVVVAVQKTGDENPGCLEKVTR